MTRAPIQLFKPIFDKEAILAEIGDCLDKSWTGIGYKTIEFEENFKSYTGIPHAHFLNSATSALHLALEIIKKNSNSPYKNIVMTSPLTFISDSHVIRMAGLREYFIDIDTSLCMSPIELQRLLLRDGRNAYVAAVIYIGIGGNSGELTQIVNICKQHRIPLILDASHMMGTYLDGRHIGNEGQDYTVFSFHAVKNLPTADSGMLCCKDINDDKLARKLSWLGINKDTYERQTSGVGNWNYNVESVGYKYHGNSIMATMGIVGLRNLEESNHIRRMQASMYNGGLRPGYHIIQPNHKCLSSRHLFQVTVGINERDKIINYAREKGVQLGVHYKCHTEYPPYMHFKGSVPMAETASKQLISLPIGPHLSEEDVQFVIGVMNDYSF